MTEQEWQSLRNLGNEAEAAADEIVALRDNFYQLRSDAIRALEAWDSTTLRKAHDGMMQERMECLRAAIAGEKT